jgi:hypothetical protein
MYYMFQPITAMVRYVELLQSPNLHVQIKLYKTQIRPIVNWCNSPAYKLAIYLTKILKQNFQSPYTYNTKNTLHLITNLQDLHIDKDTRIHVFDIPNMYTNVQKSHHYNTKHIKQCEHTIKHNQRNRKHNTYHTITK